MFSDIRVVVAITRTNRSSLVSFQFLHIILRLFRQPFLPRSCSHASYDCPLRKRRNVFAFSQFEWKGKSRRLLPNREKNLKFDSLSDNPTMASDPQHSLLRIHTVCTTRTVNKVLLRRLAMQEARQSQKFEQFFALLSKVCFDHRSKFLPARP